MLCPQLWFALLGPVVMRDGGGTVLPLRAPKSRCVLAALLLDANRVVSHDTLMAALWGSRRPATARASLSNHVLQLRRALGPENEGRIRTTAGGYAIRVDADELDVEVFLSRTRAARAALDREDWHVAHQEADAALALWQGTPLTDLPDLADAFRSRLDSLDEFRLQAHQARIEAHLGLGRPGDAIPEATRQVADHPLRESFAELLMLALYRSGRQAEALDVFERARTALADELGIDPGPALRDLHLRILAADPALDDTRGAGQTSAPRAELAAAAPAERPPVRADTTGDGTDRVGPALPVPVPVPAQLPGDVAFFTGRREELQELCALLEQATNGAGPSVVTVTGMGGVGKSALAVRAAHLLRDRFPDGQLHLDLHGFGNCTPRAAHEVLATVLADLFPGVPRAGGLPLPADTDNRSALLRSVLADRRVLIVLDNARDSAQVLPLLPGSGASAVIVTSRNTLTDLPTAHHLPLAPMDAEEQRALLAALCGHDRVEGDLDAALRILAACAGLPLALRIAGAQLAARPAWPLATLAERVDNHEFGRLAALTAGQLDLRATFASSYLALCDSDRDADREAARAFRLLGLWPGQVVSPAGAAALLDRTPAQAQDVLEQLVDAHLLQSPAPLRYRLHDLLAEYAAERADHDETAQAGESARLRLCLWYTLALENARLALGEGYQLPPRLDQAPPAPLPVFTDEAQAMTWCRQELPNLYEAIRHAGQGPRPDLTWRLAVWLGGYMRTCWWTGQWEDYLKHALQITEQQRDRLGRAWVLRTLGTCHRLARRYGRSIKALEEALALVDDPASQAATHANLSIAYGFAGQADQALTHARTALHLHRRTGGSERHSGILYNALAHALHADSQFDEAEAPFREALGIWRRYGNTNSSAITLATLGDVLGRLGRREDALAALQEAVEIFQRLGNAALAADTLITTARTHTRFAEWPEALTTVDQAVDLAERHGLSCWLSDAQDLRSNIEAAQAAKL